MRSYITNRYASGLLPDFRPGIMCVIIHFFRKYTWIEFVSCDTLFIYGFFCHYIHFLFCFLSLCLPAFFFFFDIYIYIYFLCYVS